MGYNEHIAPPVPVFLKKLQTEDETALVNFLWFQQLDTKKLFCFGSFCDVHNTIPTSSNKTECECFEQNHVNFNSKSDNPIQVRSISNMFSLFGATLFRRGITPSSIHPAVFKLYSQQKNHDT